MIEELKEVPFFGGIVQVFGPTILTQGESPYHNMEVLYS